MNCGFCQRVCNHFRLRLLENSSGSSQDDKALLVKILGGKMSSQQRRIETNIQHLEGFIEVVIILDVSTSPSTSCDNNGLVGRVEGFEVIDDLFVVFDGVEVFVEKVVEGGVLVLGVVDVGDGVGVLEYFGHFFAQLAAASDEQDLFHLMFWVFVYILFGLLLSEKLITIYL